LQNALPEATPARTEILFLPEKEDPDSLVGKVRREAFEARYTTALPLSEYPVSHPKTSTSARRRQGAARRRGAATLERVLPGRMRAAASIGWPQSSASAPSVSTIVGPMKPARIA
jgi:DNA primase